MVYLGALSAKLGKDIWGELMSWRSSFLMLVALASGVGASAQDNDAFQADEQDVEQQLPDNVGVEYLSSETPETPWLEEEPTEASEQEEDWESSENAEEVFREPAGIPDVEAVYFDASEAEQPAGPRRGSFGGHTVNDAEAPWQAQIFYPKNAPVYAKYLARGEQLWALQHVCGGALIHRQWILTAAHCVDQSMVASGHRIRLGQEDISKPGGWTYDIIDIRIHNRPPIGNGLKPNDIALIKIALDPRNVPPPSQVRPIGIYRRPDVAFGDGVSAFGWGKTSNAGRTSALLLRVPLTIQKRPDCMKRIVATIDQRVVCASSPARKTCTNDSGGPLINKAGELVGIVSGGGTSCSPDGVPTVFTFVSSFMQWIRQETGGAVR